jgi:hypothetical protein
MTMPTGQTYTEYKEVSIFSPPNEDAKWIFVVTDNIALVSDICKANTHAAVLFEPKTGWVKPGGFGLVVLGGGIALAALIGYTFWPKKKK